MEIILYIEPGSGSLIIQFLIAVVAGGLVFWSNLKMKIKSIISRLFKKQADK